MSHKNDFNGEEWEEISKEPENSEDHENSKKTKKHKKHKSKKNKKSLEYKVQKIVNKELNTGTKKFISEVHKDINFRYNSFNVAIGNQGSSKTTSVLKEVMKLSFLEDHDYHLFIYVTNNTSDETFQKLNPYIDFQIIQTTYEEIEEQFEQLIKLKDEYNKMVDEEIPYDEGILDALYIEDFSKKRLHTFILFDDASFIFDQKSKSKFKKWLTQCRHFNITVFCNIQIWHSLDAKLKSQISGVFLFKGFSRERVKYIYRQLPIEIDFEEFYQLYLSLEKYQKLVIDCIGNKIKVV